MAETQSKHLSSVLESLRAVYGAEVFASAFSLMSSVAPSAPPAASSAASSVASDPAAAPAAASSAPPKRRGPKKLAEMTPEERAKLAKQRKARYNDRWHRYWAAKDARRQAAKATATPEGA